MNRLVVVRLALVGTLLAGAPLSAQSSEPVATLSTDSVRMAEVFELRIEVAVPAGSIAYFPDTIPASLDVESHGPVEWRARRGADGGATLELTYPLMAFGGGPVALPRIDIMIMPREDNAEGERMPGGSIVGVWDERQPSVRYTRGVTPPSIYVEHVYTAEDVVAGMRPRGPDDVVGFSWSWPSVALILLFTTVIGGAVASTARGWLAERPAATPPARPPTTDEEARRHALETLDRLLASGPHGAERALEVYRESSGALRAYVERLDTTWGPELTSSELMSRLGRQVEDVEPLASEMRTAEAVKFGRLRPDAEPTAAHLEALKAWLAARPGARA